MTHITTAELDALVLRANNAGHNSIAEYALWLERALAIAQDVIEDLKEEAA